MKASIDKWGLCVKQGWWRRKTEHIYENDYNPVAVYRCYRCAWPSAMPVALSTCRFGAGKCLQTKMGSPSDDPMNCLLYLKFNFLFCFWVFSWWISVCIPSATFQFKGTRRNNLFCFLMALWARNLFGIHSNQLFCYCSIWAFKFINRHFTSS